MEDFDLMNIAVDFYHNAKFEERLKEDEKREKWENERKEKRKKWRAIVNLNNIPYPYSAYDPVFKTNGNYAKLLFDHFLEIVYIF